MKTLKVGMLGAGVVGSQIARLLIANKSDLASRAGANLELVAIAVKDSKSKRDGIPAALLTNDAKSIVNDPQIDLVIEVIGGIDPAKDLILTALNNGKSVVTANKALLAKHGAELYADLARFHSDVVALCPGLAGSPAPRVGAIVDFAYNLGVGRLKASTLRRRINEKDWASVKTELMKWINAGGRPLRGLVLRRQAEANLI